MNRNRNRNNGSNNRGSPNPNSGKIYKKPIKKKKMNQNLHNGTDMDNERSSTNSFDSIHTVNSPAHYSGYQTSPIPQSMEADFMRNNFSSDMKAYLNNTMNMNNGISNSHINFGNSAAVNGLSQYPYQLNVNGQQNYLNNFLPNQSSLPSSLSTIPTFQHQPQISILQNFPQSPLPSSNLPINLGSMNQLPTNNFTSTSLPMNGQLPQQTSPSQISNSTIPIELGGVTYHLDAQQVQTFFGNATNLNLNRDPRQNEQTRTIMEQLSKQTDRQQASQNFGNMNGGIGLQSVSTSSSPSPSTIAVISSPPSSLVFLTPPNSHKKYSN